MTIDSVSATVGGGGAAAFNNLPIWTEEPLRLAYPNTITEQNPGVSAVTYILRDYTLKKHIIHHAPLSKEETIKVISFKDDTCGRPYNPRLSPLCQRAPIARYPAR